MLKLSSSAFPSPPSCIENGTKWSKRDWKRAVSSLPRLANVTSCFSMAAAARLIRAKLSRLSLVFLNKSHTIVTLCSNGAFRWRRLHFPPRKKLHWGVALGTSGVLCGSVVLCSVSTGICLAYVNNNRFLVGLFGAISEYPLLVLFYVFKQQGSSDVIK